MNRREFADRKLYLSLEASDWLERELPGLTSAAGAVEKPSEQVRALFRRFVTGKDLNNSRTLHVMRPEADGIWELKTIDLRFFGWFPQRDVFIIACVETMERLKDPAIRDPYRNRFVEARVFQERLDLPIIKGGSLDKVVST